MEKRLITSALPYVNNIPHLGNLVQMLSADVFARFCRLRGYDTLCICGTDEYGTATETKALEEKKTPRELCDYYYNEHKKIYDWFNISFDKFGRTSNDECTKMTQGLFRDLDEAGYISEHETSQLFCKKCNRFLADRYVAGKCPKCGFEAKGDQCDNCGALLTSVELKEPHCTVCGGSPEVRNTKHLYMNLPKMAPLLEEWMNKASVDGKWAENAITITKAWIRDGLKERAITRDLKWGIDVPREGYDGKNGSPKKVFYVWFNASIGYISITQQLENELKADGKKSFDWKSYWIPDESESGDDVKLFQFIGKDNIPFHTVIFPCTLLGSPHGWTKLFHISSTEYLNYENTKFSKSRGVGVFGNDAIDSGIKADAWRFYIFYNRPEKQDFQFTWQSFMELLNSELVGNLGNLINRTLLFITKYYDGVIPQGEVNSALWDKIKALESTIRDNYEWANLKDAFRGIFEIADLCNKEFQKTEPWRVRVSEPKKAEDLLYNLSYVIKDLMIMASPFMPDYAKTVMSYFGKTIEEKRVGCETVAGLNWSDIGKFEGLKTVSNSAVYFTPMDQKTMQSYRVRYSGKQSEHGADKKGSGDKKKNKVKSEPKVLSPEEQAKYFNKTINLVVAKIIDIKRNPEGEKLYIETLDDGSGIARTIQSGLVPYLREDELLGKNIILVENLAPRKMRGVESRGMLLAADYKDSDGKDCVEVLQAPKCAPGTKVLLEGAEYCEKPANISGDDFFCVKIRVTDYKVNIAGVPLLAGGEQLTTAIAKDSDVC